MEVAKTYGLDELEAVAKWLLQHAGTKRVLAFYGKMGAGKTTLIKQICRTLNVTDNVTSPTFALINEYHTADESKVFHFDFYRINKLSEAYDLGADEYFCSGCFCMVEWPELAEELLPDACVRVHIEANERDGKRTMKVETQRATSLPVLHPNGRL
ncbi:MAG: tRNA (adenosine(37)-N6)-threonylcarbamoyltransferase complex ATPase subunit type 1 TsaE [Prevotellaceae bacterium]|jgi:tRNA threonylcarbamoyladenosine biosynthesis protein TsaE|nr:tRNA (adenosine(37)-N6)-threonylcarbamoyltransferase complex ATPase subunit type 1 TsaE [Prevotellaceae bacterium]